MRLACNLAPLASSPLDESVRLAGRGLALLNSGPFDSAYRLRIPLFEWLREA